VPESRTPRDDDRQSQDPDVLRERAERAAREREILRRENERLCQPVDHLKRQLDETRRAGYRPAAPFCETVEARSESPGAQAGRRLWPKARRRVPPRIDDRMRRRCRRAVPVAAIASSKPVCGVRSDAL